MTALLLAALTMTHASSLTQQDTIIPLSQYIVNIKWDAAKSGTLIALEPDTAFSYYGPGTKLASFAMKMSQAGKLSVIGQSWTTALTDDDIPNAYQALPDDDKICFLLATLKPSELEKLTGPGLSASELSGEQHDALISMIPNPLRYLEGTAQATSFSSTGSPISLPNDQRSQVRLQLRRGIEVMYAGNNLEGGGASYASIDSLHYRGAVAAPALSSAGALQINDDVKIPGRVVDSAEKKSDLAWTDPRLKQPISLGPKNMIGPIVDGIRSATGVEIYADARIEKLPFNAYGDSAAAGDLLHGLAIALGGTVRRVGSVYVLTADREGTATRSARLRAQLTVGAMEVETRVNAWRNSAKGMKLSQTIPFSANDALAGASVPERDFAPPGSSFQSNWAPVSDLPADLQSILITAKSAVQNGGNNGNPVPGLEGKARITSKLGYRFVLPDGRPLEFNIFDPSGKSMVSMSTTGATRQEFPVDLKTFRPGTAVAIKSDDPQVVAKLCKELKEFKVANIWLESLSPEAVKAAVDAGFTVDLLIRPWRAMKNEACPEPDRNQIGQTGTQLNGIPAAKFNPINQRTESYADSFSPAAKEATAHIDRLAKLALIPGIHGVVLMDAEPTGYQAPVGETNRSIGDLTINGVVVHPGLQDKSPGLYEFGFTTNLRETFLRTHHIDPVDMDVQVGGHYGPVSPYFQSAGFITGEFGPYPHTYFPPIAPPSDGLLDNAWEGLRRQGFLKPYAAMIHAFAAGGKPLMVEGFSTRNDPISMSPIWFVAECDSEGKPDRMGETNIRYVSINPLNAEDEAGNLDFKVRPLPTDLRFCFDLTEVPANRFVVYLRYLIKPAH